MSSNFSNGVADWLQPGRKEARERALAVQKRRLSAAALVHDVETSVSDAVFGLEIDKLDYQASDIAKMQVPLDRAKQTLSAIYNDLTEINRNEMPERITEMEAFQLMQPVLRIEARLNEARDLVRQAGELKAQFDGPKQNAKGNIDNIERRRLQVANDLQECRTAVRQLQEGRAENAPEVAAAFVTAEREATAANQMIAAARLALPRKAWLEANDLAVRAGRLYNSSSEKLETVRQAGEQFSHIAGDVQALVERTLLKLNTAKTELAAKASLVSGDPESYLQKSVQRLGEARRALKQTPPQPMTAYQLANESSSLIDEALAQAKDEMNWLKNSRLEARKALQELQESVQIVRSQLSAQKVVPVASNDMYRQARREYDRLSDVKVDELKPAQLEQVIKEAEVASRLAQQAAKLLPSP
jgi:hypothetical protein